MRDFDREFDAALDELNPDSSVGLCSMAMYGSTIADALNIQLDSFRRVYDPDRIEILRSLSKARFLDPSSADPIKVFVKPEPHKLSKIAEGRYRLISAVSLVDTMVDRVMFRWLAKAIMATVGQTPVMIGWSPLRGGYRYLLEKFRGKKTRGLDKTAWDWTVPEWLIKDCLQVIFSLAEMPNPRWTEWALLRWQALFRDAIFQFSDGTVVKQPGWGVMKSGCYLTIIINSIGQLIHHAIALRRLNKHPKSLAFVTIGDDVTVEDFEQFPEYERIILENGALLKPSEPTAHIEFAGFVYSEEGGVSRAWPEYWQKHLFAASHTGPETLEALLESYMILYAHEPNFGEWVRWVLAKINATRLSDRRVCRAIWDFEGLASV